MTGIDTTLADVGDTLGDDMYTTVVRRDRQRGCEEYEALTDLDKLNVSFPPRSLLLKSDDQTLAVLHDDSSARKHSSTSAMAKRDANLFRVALSRTGARAL